LVGLSKEPLNAGIDSLIDKATANIPDAQRGFRAIFSARQTPGASFKLEWRRGNWTGTGITARNSIRKAGYARPY
jgi:alpha-D-ribose 1-methylphosphonate 5-triphosphate synthase subunit PhnH